MTTVKPADISLRPITEADFATVADLGARIWRRHYIAMISAEQIEYMLAGRYTADKLKPYLDSDRCWLDLLEHDDQAIGYCSYAWTETAGEMKLEQLYLLPELHGRGYGGQMLRHVEARVRSLGAATLMLTVNKHNAGSIAVYRKAGFGVREEAVFDIGNGFVMDDYVMVKRLA